MLQLGFGGGICVNGGAADIYNNTIQSNVVTGRNFGDALQGGGIYASGGTAGISNNIINGNSAGYGGGVFMSYAGSQSSLHHNVIQSNTGSGEGGGMFCNGGSCPTVDGNRFIDNNGSDHGGAIALEDANTRPLIINNLFIKNVVSGTGGGAINALQAVPTIINNTFVGNKVIVGAGGAVILRSTTNVVMLNNVFYDNQAPSGLSVYSTGGSHIIAYCNAWNRPPSSNAPATHFRNSSGTLIAGVDAVSCFYADPCFVSVPIINGEPDYLNGDYHLQAVSLSPCIDKGINWTNTSPYDKVPLDNLEGNPRPVEHFWRFQLRRCRLLRYRSL